jgi:SAM-dependent methyltransferase
LLLPMVVLLVYLLYKEEKFLLRGLLPLVLAASIALWSPPPPQPELTQANPADNGRQVTPVTARHSTIWSPYQRLDLTSYTLPDGEKIGLELGANHHYYQYFFNDTKPRSDLPTNFEKLIAGRKNEYNFPYQLGKPGDVLVVGCGAGQNVLAAVNNGAVSVDACDIDPAILRIGKEFNPSYSAPNVRLICDDARHYFAHSDRKYDLIVFGLLDSHALTGQGSSVRTDTYVYTKEGLADAYKLLMPGGKIVLSFQVWAPWVVDRFYQTIVGAAGINPLIFWPQGNDLKKNPDMQMFFVFGPGLSAANLNIPPGWSEGQPPKEYSGRILTDDWPYLYVRPDVFDLPFFLIIAETLALAAYASRKVIFTKADPVCWQMFFMGAAFLLLELHSISFLSLLYGSTWLTSAIAINGILVLILIANMFVMRLSSFVAARSELVYAALFGALLLDYFNPVVRSAFGDEAVYYLAVTIITLFPMCVAAVIFASSFAAAAIPARALAFNLIGAVVGGLLEYLSNYWGIKAMVGVAALLYFLSFLCLRRARRGG